MQMNSPDVSDSLFLWRNHSVGAEDSRARGRGTALSASWLSSRLRQGPPGEPAIESKTMPGMSALLPRGQCQTLVLSAPLASDVS